MKYVSLWMVFKGYLMDQLPKNGMEHFGLLMSEK
jgi:hypothetical protein